MFGANNEYGVKVSINDAIKENHYFCPFCGGKMRVCAGESKIPYFAHIRNTCIDLWRQKDTEWTNCWKSQFPLEAVERKVEIQKVFHIADIELNKVVVLFQQARLHADTFIERTDYYRNNHHVIWVFDLHSEFDKGNLYYDDNSKELLWKNPRKTFERYIANENVSIMFELEEDTIILLEDLHGFYTKRKQAIAIKRLTRKELLKYVNDVSKGIDPLLEDKEKAAEEEKKRIQQLEVAEKERQEYIAKLQKIKEEQLAAELEKQRKEAEEKEQREKEAEEKRRGARERKDAEALANAKTILELLEENKAKRSILITNLESKYWYRVSTSEISRIISSNCCYGQQTWLGDSLPPEILKNHDKKVWKLIG